ncbi:MAG: hypothetical protein K1000chlam3_00069 [Chlamydiae bacterium]|nr:hypothetical protein [Chlamydiota bacterium]
MLGNQLATVFSRTELTDGTFSCPGAQGVVLDEHVILEDLKFLSKRVKENLLSRFLETRCDQFLVLFRDWSIGLFKPDDVVVISVDDWKVF